MTVQFSSPASWKRGKDGVSARSMDTGDSAFVLVGKAKGGSAGLLSTVKEAIFAKGGKYGKRGFPNKSGRYSALPCIDQNKSVLPRTQSVLPKLDSWEDALRTTAQVVRMDLGSE